MAEEQDKAFDNIILIDKEPSVPDNTLADAQRPLTPEAEIPAPTQPTKRKLPDSFGQRTALNHGKKKKGGKVGSRGAIGGRTRSQPTLVPTELGWIKDEPVPSTIHPPSREAMNYTISGVPIKFPFKVCWRFGIPDYVDTCLMNRPVHRPMKVKSVWRLYTGIVDTEHTH